MDVRLAALASELTKIAAEQEGKRRGYLGAVAAAAPYAAVTAAADVPKGSLDKAVENLVRTGKPWGAKGESTLLQGVGRGGARLGAGLATAPVFLSGINDLKSDEKGKKLQGAAKVVGSGLVYSAMKGGGEAAVANLGKSPGKIWQAIKNTAGSRSIVGAGAALLTAAAVAKATKASDKRKAEGQSLIGKVIKQGIMPAAAGMAAGAGKGAFDEVYKDTHLRPLLRGKKPKLPTLRGIAAKSSGRMASGALGALVMTHAIKHLMPSKKNPKVKRWQKVKTAQATPDIGPSGGDIYEQMRGWAKDRNDVDVYQTYKQMNAGGIGERSPARRAAFYALHDELGARGHKMPTPKLREKVKPKLAKAPGALETAALLAVASTPMLGMAVVSALPPGDRDRVLSDALDKMLVQKGLARRDVDPSAPFFDLPEELVGKRTPSRMGEPHYFSAGGREEVVLPKRGKELPGIVAHEMGHASAGSIRRLAMSTPSRIAHTAGAVTSVLLPLLAMDSLGDDSFTTAADLESRAKLLAGLGTVTGALQAPVLAEETAAQVKAIKYLRQAGASLPEALGKSLLHTGPGYASYAVPVALPFLVAAGLKGRAMLARSRD